MKTHFSTLGIIISTLGSYLVWRYLTELNFADKEAYLKGQGVLVVPDPTPSDVVKFNNSIRLSKLGLGLIFIGGFVQVVSNYLPDL
jgi:hypothetical protein